jgi:hypothetical protein
MNISTGVAKKSKMKPALVGGAFPVPPDWSPIAKNLASTLRKLDEDQYLIISVKRSTQFIQFAAQGSFGLRMEVASNYYLPDTEQLSDQQMAALNALGWKSPTRNPELSTPKDDPHGSPNFFIDVEVPVKTKVLAELAVRTFSEVLNVSHPSALEYEAFCKGGGSLPLPALGLRRGASLTEAEQVKALPQRLLDQLRESTGLMDLTYDDDQDIGGIHYGDTTVYVRLMGNPPRYIRFFSVLLTELAQDQKLLEWINELNSVNGYMHVTAKGGAVIVFSDILAIPFISSQIEYSLKNFCQEADTIKGKLQVEFGQETVISQREGSHVVH